MYTDYNFLLLAADSASKYTMAEIRDFSNVKIINKSTVFSNAVLNIISKIYLSTKLNNKINLPLKKIIYKKIFRNITFVDNSKPLCIVLTTPWYDKQLIDFVKNHFQKPKLILRCADTVKHQLQSNKQMSINIMKNVFDGVLVYSNTDAIKYGFVYCPVGYSKMDRNTLPKYKHSDVVFIGAAKDRLEEIHNIYRKLSDAGLTCDFYVTGVNKKDRIIDGICYADKGMTFKDYIAREIASDCILEILQHNSTGRSYRMMEAVIYNKKLITNCKEIEDMKYNKKHYVMLYENIDDIDPTFIKNEIKQIDYKYMGEFSPIRTLECISTIIES